MSTPKIRSFYQWVVCHDDSRMFVVLYIGLAVVLSVFISLFWLVVVVGIHFAFELVRQRYLLDGRVHALAQALWELRLDAALIVFAMAVALYMDFVIGVAGLRLVPRLGRAISMGARSGARFAAWNRVIRGVLLSVDDAAQFVRAAMFRKRRVEQTRQKNETSVVSNCSIEPTPISSQLGSWANPWRLADYLVASFFLLSILLVILAPILSERTGTEVFTLLISELHPFPAR